MKAYFCFLLLASLGMAVQALTLCVEFSPLRFVEYQIPDYPQTLNIILTAPHGGNLKPAELPDRKNGCEQNNECVWEHDCVPKKSSCKVNKRRNSMTEEITRAISHKLFELTGKHPYAVFSLMHRRKADMDREIGEATLNFPATVEEYNAFYYFLTNATTTISSTTSNSRTILFDIHAVEGHPEKWVELGYHISASDLNSGSYTADDSSIANLAHDVCGTDLNCFNQLLYGPYSFGGFLQAQGIEVVPSPQYNSPGSEGYSTGGYITQTHGALEQVDLDAIRVEIPRLLRLNGTYLDTANKIAIAINEYVNFYNVYSN